MKIKDVLNIKTGSRGGILVEFALAVPFFVAIFYFAIDVPKHSRYKSQMKSATYYATSMIQNVTNGREDKRVTGRDLKRICWTCFYNIFHGKQIASPYPRGFYPYNYIYYVKGVTDSTAQVMWRTDKLYPHKDPDDGALSIVNFQSLQSTVKYHVNAVDPKSIHKDLQIKKDEVKIIVESILVEEASKKFGFYIFKPKSRTNNNCYYHTVVIFTPTPGIFSETPPIP